MIFAPTYRLGTDKRKGYNFYSDKAKYDGMYVEHIGILFDIKCFFNDYFGCEKGRYTGRLYRCKGI